MGKSIGKTRLACVLCAVALCFGIALAGCSSGSSSSAASGSASADSSTSSAAASSESASASGDAAASEDVASAAAATKSMVQSNDTSAAADFDSLPTSDDADAAALESGEVEEGTDDASKAPADATVLQAAGIQIYVPKTWSVAADVDGYAFENPEGTVLGYIYGYPKQAGEKVDTEALVKSVPSAYAQMGYTNIEVIGYGSLYSSKGTLIGGEISFAGTANGTEYIFYIAVIESASYINVVEFGGAVQDIYANLDTVDAIITSVSFVAGEAI